MAVTVTAEEAVDLILMRKKCAKIIRRIFEKRGPEIGCKLTEDKIILLARNLEKEIMTSSKKECIRNTQRIKINDHYSDKFVRIYDNIARCVLLNLDPKTYIKNYFVIGNLLKEILTPQQVLEITLSCPQGLCPERNKHIFEQIEKEEDAAYNRKLPITSQYRCGKCKQNKCVVNQAQLRSADESMTVLVTCLNCGNKWMF